MENQAIIESFLAFKEEKNIDRVTLMAFIEEAFRNQLRKKYETCLLYTSDAADE